MFKPADPSLYLGKKIYRWTVQEFHKNTSTESTKVTCQCECGTIKKILLHNLLHSKTKSCGCLALEIRIKHGLIGTTDHNIWSNMKQRCTNKKNTNYRFYGARGIKVCDRWLNSFINFTLDMGPRPSKEFTLDRIDNNGNYEPSNCRWATWKQQVENKRTTKGRTVGGRKKKFNVEHKLKN